MREGLLRYENAMLAIQVDELHSEVTRLERLLDESDNDTEEIEDTLFSMVDALIVKCDAQQDIIDALEEECHELRTWALEL